MVYPQATTSVKFKKETKQQKDARINAQKQNIISEMKAFHDKDLVIGRYTYKFQESKRTLVYFTGKRGCRYTLTHCPNMSIIGYQGLPVFHLFSRSRGIYFTVVDGDTVELDKRK